MRFFADPVQVSSGTDTFDRPTCVAVAPNGDIFVCDRHSTNKHPSVPKAG
jgi:NHL repeat